MSNLSDVGALGAAAGLSSGNPALMIGGSLLGMFGGGGKTGPSLQELISGVLNKGLNNAITSNNQYSGYAVDQQNKSLQNAIDATNQFLSKATSTAQNQANQGLQAYQTLQQPWANAGYNALDSYMSSLGMATPVGGSQNLVRNTQLAQQLAPLLSSFKGNFNAPVAPTMINGGDLMSKITPAQIMESMNAGENWKVTNLNQAPAQTAQSYQAMLANNEAARLNQQAQSSYQPLFNTYNTNMGQLNNLLSGANLTSANMQRLAPLLRQYGFGG